MKNKKRLILYGFLGMFLVVCSGATIWGINIFRNMDFGMMGGDCPEMTSYGGVSITGQVVTDSNNSNKEIHIIANKPKGGCPQSVAIDKQEFVVQAGDKISTGYDIHLGDPALEITINAAGYDSCELIFTSAIPSEDVDWKITLGDKLIVEQKTIEYHYTQDKNGKVGIATWEPFGTPTYHQVCPEVN